MMLRNKGRLGNAVLLVILLIPILVFLARSVAWLASTSHFRSVSHRQDISSTFIMEAGLNHASILIMEDATWEEGFDKEPMTRTSGSYTITFQPSGSSYREGNSVNNIFGTTERDGPRGPDTVVPGTAELVVHSQSGNTESSGTFLLQAIFDNNNEFAVSSAGHIRMVGDVDVQGVENVETWATTNAGAHANVYQDLEAAILWKPGRLGDQAHFTGTVSTPSRGERAISFEGTEGLDYSAGNFEDSVGRLAIPVPDILQEVANHAGGRPVPVVSFGKSTLTPGDYFYSGDLLDIQGDIELEPGANLYVAGSLNVNGSIRGEGSVYVTGKTVFKGDAYIEAGMKGVALYSEGSISMLGFSGQEFMERLGARNPSIQQHYNRAKSELLESSDRTPDNVQRDHNNAAMNSIRAVRDIVHAEVPAGSETSDFVRDQLTAFYEVINRSHDDGTYGRAEMGEIYREIRYGLDRVGASYFKGLLVTNSYILTESSVAVVGAVWATGANESDATTQHGDWEIKPGDVLLNDDTSFLLNKELLEDDENASPTRLKGLDMLRWQR